MQNIVRPPAVAFLLLLVSSVCAEDRFASFDNYIRDGMETWRVPGLAIAVVKDGELALARGYGVRHMGRDEPVTADTVFSIASCTKSFTASCIAMLVDEGKVQWDDPVRKHLPEFRVADPYVTETVTLRDLLCHRTGLVRGDLLAMSGGFTHEEMLGRVQFLQQAVPFRSKFTYHNVMYTILGEIVEKKSGMKYEEFVRTRLFESLEMKSSTTDRKTVTADRLAMRHRLYDGELSPLRTSQWDLNAPAGAIHSTVGDMIKWVSLQLREGELDGKQIIKPTTLREMYSLQQSIPLKRRPDSDVYDAHFAGFGLGWFVRDYRGRKLIQHGGAWGAEVSFVPELNLGIVVLSNRDWNGLAWMLTYDVIDAYVVGPEQAWSKGKKWDRWQQIGGVDQMDRDRKEQRAELEKNRKPGTRPSRPLRDYVGTYRSILYPDLRLSVVEDHLHVKFGDYGAPLEHWDDDTFYGRTVIEPFIDWHVKFDMGADGTVRGLEFINIGWKEPDERFVFVRDMK